MGEESGLEKGHVVRRSGKGRAGGAYPLLWGSAGSVLLVLIVTMVILAALTAALLPILFTTEVGQVSASQAMKAYYLAEAGGRYTLPRLQDITVGTHVFKFGDGSTTFFEIEKISNTHFTSTGVVDEGGDLEARVTITYQSERMFDYAVFGGDWVTIGNNGLVDSYSSSGDPTDGENGNVGTNGGTITVGINTDIHGEQELLVGKGMTPEDLPADWMSWTNKTWELNMFFPFQTVTLGTGEYYTTALNISVLSTVNITGDVVLYVQGTTSAWSNSTLNISSGASLTIYAGGSMYLANNNLVNPDQIPAHFTIYGLAGCGNITLYGNSDIHTAIYAPTADIYVWNNATVYGSLVGETVTTGTGVQIHYDEDLQNIDSDNADFEQYFTGD